MKLSPHFSLAEFEASDTAARKGINNKLPPELYPQAMETAAMLERIREALGGVPIIITSGYRCPALNKAIGGSKSSDHLQAFAVDWKAPSFGTPFAICKALAPKVQALGVGQLIHEFGTWVHVSSRLAPKEVNRVITITAAGTRAGIWEA